MTTIPWFLLMFRVVMAKGRRLKKLGGDLEVQKYYFIKIDNWETKCYSITTKT
jgi:hypothetical protein